MKEYRGIRISNGISEGRLRFMSTEDLKDTDCSFDKGTILVARELQPNILKKLEKDPPVAFVTEIGAVNTHTSILMRNMGIPAVAGIHLSKADEGKNAVIDANNELVIVEPSSNSYRKYQQKRAIYENEQSKTKECYRAKDAITRKGKRVYVYANITSVSEASRCEEWGADGIGVLKTEFLYMESRSVPSEQEQFDLYKKVAKMMNNKRTIIRTIDIGTDKVPPYFDMDTEPNPALGYRGIRMCLENTELFKTQLRAIIRASAYGNVAILYPMIVSVDELLKAKEIVAEIMDEFDTRGIPYSRNIEQGIMIETPAAVLIAKELAKYSDFFSLGTNDLVQYLVAADRQNPRVGKLLNPYHAAVEDCIKYTINSAHKAGIWASVSGEVAGDDEYVKKLVGYDVDGLAVSLNKIPNIKRIICDF